ncbi:MULTISPECIES: nuclear transport factor 2 family protein [unclassified Kitasatospora]|uniref:nuclear transport factor 2 family protein n=1 Tax=unclassified Kitasatospora TaxID=2633591 RepID=UPI00070BBD67|nr:MULTISPECIES: nuclear transport factor 2 family protein [unclassified Kitasatospora]KQV18720.1 hypothetical protein ASC99_05840 [Kitasatospora sp. Root107]KRB74701.1 hypothetical protein ASE03_19775 [Kitasatospora sp. Root187]
MDDRLQELFDRNEITDLISRQGRWLDEGVTGDGRDLFTEDAVAETPGGLVQGVHRLVAQARHNHTEDTRTQHSITDVLIERDGDRASVRANLRVAFAPLTGPDGPRFMGGVYRWEVVRTPQGWRFAKVQATPVWRHGDWNESNLPSAVRATAPAA